MCKAFCHEKGVPAALAMLSVDDQGVVLAALNLLSQLTSVPDTYFNPLLCKIVVASGTKFTLIS